MKKIQFKNWCWQLQCTAWT